MPHDLPPSIKRLSCYLQETLSGETTMADPAGTTSLRRRLKHFQSGKLAMKHACDRATQGVKLKLEEYQTH
ncbi:hypothetical protein IG631_16760 [Alternaria alternata]|nr:hypothetical protein IG631_16760 [Alternaria alternata]